MQCWHRPLGSHDLQKILGSRTSCPFCCSQRFPRNGQREREVIPTSRGPQQPGLVLTGGRKSELQPVSQRSAAGTQNVYLSREPQPWQQYLHLLAFSCIPPPLGPDSNNVDSKGQHALPSMGPWRPDQTPLHLTQIKWPWCSAGGLSPEYLISYLGKESREAVSSKLVLSSLSCPSPTSATRTLLDFILIIYLQLIVVAWCWFLGCYY